VIYSLWIVLIACTFWFVKFDNNVTILQALMDAGRYPATVYPVWMRILVTFVVPIAVATTVPLQALRGELGWWQMLVFRQPADRRAGVEAGRAALQRRKQLVLLG
jgi:ABC-2 type transport system permease protein